MVSEEQHKSDNRGRPVTDEFRAFVASDWAPRSTPTPVLAEVAPYAALRRATVSAAFPGERLVIPAGGLKVRSNDCDYIFRPHSAFAYLTGLGGDREPDAVLVLEPLDDGSHESILYFRPLAGRETEEFFGDSRYGEFWVGARPGLADIEAELGLSARHIDDFTGAVGKDVGATGIRVVRDADRDLTAVIDSLREGTAGSSESETLRAGDEELAHFLSTQRLVKDEWEIGQMRDAIKATANGFDAVIAALPEALERGRGERWVEGVFGLHARHQGNGVGYDSICAAGDHASTLHWIKNTGDVNDGELLLDRKSVV